MAKFPLPFVPLREEVYSPTELFARFDPARPQSYADTPDFAIYRHYLSSGKSAPADYFVAMMEALHDNSITQALNNYLQTRSARSVAVMGGHELARNSHWYSEVARISRNLASRGFTMLSGGGPGAMEATHLGAAFSSGTQTELAAAIKKTLGLS